MTKIKYIFSFVFLTAALVVNAQTNPGDLKLKFADKQEVTDENDPSFLLPEGFSELNLSFTLTDTLHTHGLQIELAEKQGGQITLERFYTMEELRSHGFIQGSFVSIPLGYYQKTKAYELFLDLKDFEGLSLATIKKNC